MEVKKVVAGVVIGGMALTVLLSAQNLFETNEDGYFQIKQAVWTGDMSVRNQGGTYFQGFGSIWTYKNTVSIGFGSAKDQEGDKFANLAPIPVMFNEGSEAKITGSIKLKLPTGEKDRLKLKSEYSGGMNDFVNSGIVPIIKNSVKLSANLRSAQDAYTTMALFQQAIQDQIENGTYVTKSDRVETITSTGEKETRQVTVIVNDANGQPKRVTNKLQELGCELISCVIDVPDFGPTVKKSISRRKDEAMKTELAKQEALRAKQDALTAEEQGKANVAKAKYEEEVEKIKEVTQAQKKFEVAEFNAKTALENKKAIIAKGEGDARAAALKVKAGLSPIEAARFKKETCIGIARELAKRPVPKFVIEGSKGGSGNSTMDVITMQGMLNVMKSIEKNAK